MNFIFNFLYLFYITCRIEIKFYLLTLNIIYKFLLYHTHFTVHHTYLYIVMLYIILLTEFSYIFRYTVIFFTPVYCGSWVAPKSVTKEWGHFHLFILQVIFTRVISRFQSHCKKKINKCLNTFIRSTRQVTSQLVPCQCKLVPSSTQLVRLPTRITNSSGYWTIQLRITS